jgi:hypothetical protein
MIAAIALSCLATGAGYQIFATVTARRNWALLGPVSVQWYWPPFFLLLIGWICLCICIMAEFVFLAHLARRLGDHFMARIGLWVGAFAAASSVMLMYGSQAIIMQGEPLGAFGAVVALWFLSLLCAGLTNLDLAVRLATTASAPKGEVFH